MEIHPQDSFTQTVVVEHHMYAPVVIEAVDERVAFARSDILPQPVVGAERSHPVMLRPAYIAFAARTVLIPDARLKRKDNIEIRFIVFLHIGC